MADGESDYKVGPGRPPLHTRFRNPRGRSAKSLPALLTDAFNKKVYVTIDGRRRKITKPEAIVTQMVNKSTSADLRATKMLIDMMKGVEQKAGLASPPLQPLTVRLDAGAHPHALRIIAVVEPHAPTVVNSISSDRVPADARPARLARGQAGDLGRP